MTFSLRTIPLFMDLPTEAQRQIEDCLILREYTAGQVIFRMGDPGDEMILVEHGKIAIFDPKEPNALIRIFQDGETLGEMAVIEHKPRSLSARAELPTRVWVLRSDDFHRLLANNPHLADAMLSSLSERVRYTTDFLLQVGQWAQLVMQGKYRPEDFANLSAQYPNPSMANLAAKFAQMALEVKRREEDLQRQIIELKVEIDEVRRQQEVQKITQSDQFRDLRALARDLRADRED
jgi:CRP-like cAMP-binding protein